MPKLTSLAPAERIESMILFIRGEKVMLDEDLAKLYGTTTKRPNEQVRRNARRFPSDFMFVLTHQEVRDLKSQFATSSSWGGRRRGLPRVFTEHGVAMLSSVLNSDRAIEVNILIMRAFVKLRLLLATHVELARKLDALERRYDAQFRVVFDAIRELMKPPEPTRRSIGFRNDNGTWPSSSCGGSWPARSNPGRAETLSRRGPSRSCWTRPSASKYGYPPDKQEKATQTVLEQAEVLSELWAA